MTEEDQRSLTFENQ